MDTVVADSHDGGVAALALRAHDREQRAEIERLKDEVNNWRMSKRISGDLQRVRDARVEAPSDCRVHSWDEGNTCWEVVSTGWLLNHVHERPFWLPMPPAPEVKP